MFWIFSVWLFIHNLIGSQRMTVVFFTKIWSIIALIMLENRCLSWWDCLRSGWLAKKSRYFGIFIDDNYWSLKLTIKSYFHIFYQGITLLIQLDLKIFGIYIVICWYVRASQLFQFLVFSIFLLSYKEIIWLLGYLIVQKFFRQNFVSNKIFVIKLKFH